MRLLKKYLSKNKGRIMLIIFPHLDDESFVTGGFIQSLVKNNIEIKLISLTEGASDDNYKDRKKEFISALRILGVKDYEIWKNIEGNLNKSADNWGLKLKSVIEKIKPFCVISFDPSGITGNGDHILSSFIVLKIIKELKKEKPDLLWRISNKEEKKYFFNDKMPTIDKNPTFIYKLSIFESIKKISAIFSYKSQLRNMFFRLRIFDWYLFDHKEPYYLVDKEKDIFEFKYY